MARLLLVGCGCRGRELAAALAADGHAVRGTTRDPARLAAIEATGAEAVLADPDRLATLTSELEGVSALCWLMGSASEATASVAALHGPRLESLLEALVDTHVRGFVYEAAGSVDPALLAGGADAVRDAERSYRMRVATIETDPGDFGAWLADAQAAVSAVLQQR